VAESDLTLPATVALELGIGAGDPRLPRLISVASSAIARHLNRRLHYGATITEGLKGFGRNRLALDVCPIVAITSITLSDGSLVPPSSYSIENAEAGLVYASIGWPSTGLSRGGLPPQNDLAAGSEAPLIGVVYSGGWVCPAQSGTRNLPPELEECAIQTVISLYRGNGKDPSVAAEGLGDYSVTYRAPELGQGAGLIPDAVIATLAKFARPLG
jgi:hypothetical protein